MRGRLTAGVLTVSLIMAGCAGESPVSPLPTEAAVGAAPVGSVSVTPSPSPSRPASASPPSRRPPVGTPPSSRTPTRPSSPSSSSSCEGAIVRTIDATAEELALVPAMCLAVGAVLRVENIGPGEVTTDSPDLVAQHYEAGVVEVRFVRKGTVVVAIPQGGTTYDITVVVR
ncbi:hypothetical protein [Actinoplanes regularis]|uniref:Uncharacterized protein n=1 Tax=Actinoplanes regularis TaxID=52697 RepID=A0A239A6K7_9ACTN|nr:hypothetical protein [Actinoplanes regularis]GIE87077.1 hypothetical protein Are01nite_35570 [Actinoplanes regularis]SNR90941.1 hypothetical protein SAMN06264365_10785 [Actinoplanes regularis]